MNAEDAGLHSVLAPGPEVEVPAGVDDAPLCLNQAQYLTVQDVARREARPLWPFHIPVLVELKGPIDLDALRRALGTLSARHESLRTCFAPVCSGGGMHYRPRAVAVAPIPLDVADVDSAAAVWSARVDALVDRLVLAPFARDRAPLIRAVLVRSPEPTHLLVLVVHHLVADGWSTRLLVRDLEALYARERGLPAVLPDVRYSMSDYARWQRRQVETGRFDAAIAYWSQRWRTFHEDQLRYESLPFASPPSGDRKLLVGLQAVEIGGAECRAIRAFMTANRYTFYMLLLAAFATVVTRATGRRRYGLLGNFANRGLPGSEQTCGWFSNAHLIGFELGDDTSAAALYAQVRRAVLEAVTYQAVPLAAVWRSMGERLDWPDPRFTFQTLPEPWHAAPLSDLAFRQVSRRSRLGSTDMAIRAVERPDRFELSVAFSRSRFAPTVMAHLLADLRTAIVSGTAHPWRDVLN